MYTLPTLDKEIFDQLKASWENAGHFLINDPETFDQGIARAINAINSIPDLIVIKSQEGNPKDKFKNYLGFISVCCLNPEAFHRIYSLAASKAPTFMNRFTLSFSYRKRPLVIDGRRDYFYPYWSIQWNATSNTCKEGIEILTQAAEQISLEYQ